jgi:hypothetical protein
MPSCNNVLVNNLTPRSTLDRYVFFFLKKEIVQPTLLMTTLLDINHLKIC